jgi:glyceraldehyde 3-phosphate dehydrogenase
MINIAINGFGRIGRQAFKIALTNKNIKIVAINDLASTQVLSHLLKYDTAYGRSGLDIKVSEDKKSMKINGREVKFVSEKDPKNLPWKDLGVDVVVESTGFFTSYDSARAHVEAGAKKVVISAPAKDDPVLETDGMILMGVNCEHGGSVGQG